MFQKRLLPQQQQQQNAKHVSYDLLKKTILGKAVLSQSSGDLGERETFLFSDKRYAIATHNEGIGLIGQNIFMPKL